MHTVNSFNNPLGDSRVPEICRQQRGDSTALYRSLQQATYLMWKTGQPHQSAPALTTFIDVCTGRECVTLVFNEPMRDAFKIYGHGHFDNSFTIIPHRLGVMALPASLWEGSDRARAELESLFTALRPYIPFLQRHTQPQPRLHHLSVSQQAKAKQRGIRALLEASTVVDGVSLWRARLLSSVSVIQFGGVAAAAVSALSPQVSVEWLVWQTSLSTR